MKFQHLFSRLVLIVTLIIYFKSYNEVDANGVVMNFFKKRYRCEAIGTPKPRSTRTRTPFPKYRLTQSCDTGILSTDSTGYYFQSKLFLFLFINKTCLKYIVQTIKYRSKLSK